MVRDFLRILLAAMLMAAASPALAASSGNGQPMLLPVDPAPLVAETASGEHRFQIEIADTDAERAQGLMFRRVMPDDRGMLFVFERTRRLAFWMKNTPMPLDLLFIDADGVVRAIRQGVPFSEAEIAPPVEARFVLELKAGTAQKAGIAEGARFSHPQIEATSGN